MKKIYFLAVLVFLLSCNFQKEEQQNKSVETPELTTAPDFNVALQFINEYIEKQDNSQTSQTENWIQNHLLLSKEFKKSYKKLVDNAYKRDPEIGLGFDPILNAQDFPDKGFVIAKSDTASGYVIVKGIDWENFKVAMKMISENGKWLVDGSGIINIPQENEAMNTLK